jgi:hypothetical protein
VVGKSALSSVEAGAGYLTAWIALSNPIDFRGRSRLLRLQFLQGSPKSLAVRFLNPVLSDLIGR